MVSTGKLTGVAFPIENSDFYQEWLAEKQAIDVHKWLLSESIGRDVGWDYAQWDWIMRGFRANWLKTRHQPSDNQR